MIQQLASDIRVELGEDDATTQNDTEFKYEIVVNQGHPCCNAVLDSLDSIVEFMEFEWDRYLWLRHESELAQKSNHQDEVFVNRLSNIKINLEKSIHTRIDSIVDVFEQLLRASIESPTLEKMLTALLRLYKLLTTITKTNLSNVNHLKNKKSLLCPEYQQLVDSSCQKLTEHVYKLINKMNSQQGTDTSNKKSKKDSRAKIGRDLKMIPDLIFHIEQYELELIKLSKDTGVNLVQNLKRSTVREFKINTEQVKEVETKEEKQGSEDEAAPKKKTTRKKKANADQDDAAQEKPKKSRAKAAAADGDAEKPKKRGGKAKAATDDGEEDKPKAKKSRAKSTETAATKKRKREILEAMRDDQDEEKTKKSKK
ncbi:hypothetical protein AKO1_005462 [Acrasis kona]|uniref:FANCI solenoid 4 domain-containing protein n=1 Tax=Acrasis kona TaxID=1008807 RepID=A0AAW2ZMJ8_9EUKA